MKKKFVFIRTLHQDFEMALFQSMELVQSLLIQTKDMDCDSPVITVVAVATASKLSIGVQQVVKYSVIIVCRSFNTFKNSDGTILPNGAFLVHPSTGQANPPPKKFEA